MTFIPTRLCLTAVLLLCGCAQLPSVVYPRSAAQPWTPHTAPNGAIVVDAPAANTAALAARPTFVLPVNQGLASLAQPVVVADHDYTLADLIDLAQLNNPDTRIAWASAKITAGAVGISNSAYLPQITASIFGAHTSADSSVASYGIDASGRNSASGTLSALNLTWLLYDFGERGAVQDAAQQNAIAANAAFNGTHQRLMVEVALSYYRYGAALIRAQASAGAVQNALLIEDSARQRREQGLATVVEAAQARQYRSQAQLAAVQGHSEQQNAYQALLAALGLSPLTKMHIAALVPKPLPDDLSALSEQYINGAVARRPDVLAAYAAEQSALAAVRSADAEFKPKVFAAANGSYSSTQLGLTPGINAISGPTMNLAGDRGGWAVMLGISVPLYDGNLRSNQLMQAQATADKAAATLDKVRLEAIRQIVHAQNDIETGYASYQAAQELSAAAQISHDAAMEAYRQGQGTLTAVTSAGNALLTAQIAVGDAYSTALASVVNLVFATGQLGAYSDIH